MATYWLEKNPNEPVPVVAFTLKGEYVGHYKNYDDAGFHLNIAPGGITMFLAGRQSRAGQYIFVKQSEYKEGMKITHESIKRKRAFLKRGNQK